MPIQQLLGPAEWNVLETDENGSRKVEAKLERKTAAEIQARLRKLGFNGEELAVDVSPKIPRPWVREARALEARHRRNTTPGFEKSGAVMDDEGRVSLTPESIALQIGELARGLKVVEVGCGVGGNTLGFARSGCGVIAIDQSESRLELAKHNAKLYGVFEQIEFCHRSAQEMLANVSADLLFIDPPWGKDWNRQCCRLADFPVLVDMLAYVGKFKRCWIKLPSSFDPRSLNLELSGVLPFFGSASGDKHRVKFLLVQLEMNVGP